MAIFPFIPKLAERLGLRRGGYDRRLFEALRAARRWRPGDLVFDVGANDGRTVRRLRRHLPRPRIVAYEPVLATYEKLRQAAKPFGDDVACVRLALGARPQRREIYLHASAALNSLDPAWGSAVGSELIEIDTLDNEIARRGLRDVHLLKIDVEGHDLEVLKGAAAALAAGVFHLIQIEAGFEAPGPRQPSLEDIRRFLAPHDYHLYGVYNQCRAALASRRGGRASDGPDILVYCDALFVSGRARKPAPA